MWKFVHLIFYWFTINYTNLLDRFKRGSFKNDADFQAPKKWDFEKS